MEFNDQESFVEWVFEEPHAGFHLLTLDPVPGDALPDAVILRWGSPDLQSEEDRFFVWRLRCERPAIFRLQGTWTTGYPCDVYAHEPDAAMCIYMVTPGPLLIECERIVVEEEGWVVEPFDGFTWSHYLRWDATDRTATVGEVLAHLGLPLDAAVVSYSGISVNADQRLVELPAKSARAWRIGADGDSELVTLIVGKSDDGYDASCERRDAASDALWQKAYRLPNVLPGVRMVRSGNVECDVADWDLQPTNGLEPSSLVPPGGADPSAFARALEPGPDGN
jgi:hypothetical protein